MLHNGYDGFKLGAADLRVPTLTTTLFFQALEHHVQARRPLKATGSLTTAQEGDSHATLSLKEQLDTSFAYVGTEWSEHVGSIPTSLNALSQMVRLVANGVACIGAMCLLLTLHSVYEGLITVDSS